jgi:hypothetical protein
MCKALATVPSIWSLHVILLQKVTPRYVTSFTKGLFWWGEPREECPPRGFVSCWALLLCGSPFALLQPQYDAGRGFSPSTVVQLQQLVIDSAFLFSGHSLCRWPPSLLCSNGQFLLTPSFQLPAVRSQYFNHQHTYMLSCRGKAYFYGKCEQLSEIRRQKGQEIWPYFFTAAMTNKNWTVTNHRL